MSTIWKARLTIPGGFVAPTKIQHQDILYVGLDPNGVPCVWFRAPEEEPYLSEVLLVGTGKPVPEDSTVEYIGSFNYRTFVLHAFRRDVTE